MKILRSKTGPFKEQPYFSQSEIETLCIDELGNAGLLPDTPAPIRIDRFIEKRFGKPHSYETLEDGVLGLTRFGAKGVEEVVLAESLEHDTSKAAERRLRTTLAHEVGHGLLHAHLFVLGETRPLFGDWSDAKRPKVLCREPRADYRGDWWEYQANMVMGTILMPRSLVIQAIQPHVHSTGSLGLVRLRSAKRGEVARSLSEVFDVNPAVATIRLAGLFPEESVGQMAL